MPVTDTLDDYGFVYTEHTRFDDLNAANHISNIAFAIYAESARVAWGRQHSRPLMDKGHGFVLAHIEIDFLHEMQYPGTVEIGIKPVKIGSSSVTFRQALFQNGICCAVVDAVVVQFDVTARKAKPFSETMRAKLTELMAN